jgi:hypothetical protein
MNMRDGNTDNQDSRDKAEVVKELDPYRHMVGHERFKAVVVVRLPPWRAQFGSFRRRSARRYLPECTERP